jgi:hypothetical protein
MKQGELNVPNVMYFTHKWYYFSSCERGAKQRVNNPLSAHPELVEGHGGYAAMVRQAHHERFLSDPVYFLTLPEREQYNLKHHHQSTPIPL